MSAQEIQLKCFGVGDGWPGATLNHSAFLYRFPSRAVLVDCGESISRSYKASELDYDLFDDVLISHLHCDHIGGFFMFMQGLWLEKRTKPLSVYLPGYGIEPVRQMLRAAYIFEELLTFEIQYRPIEQVETLDFGPLRVVPHATSHLENLRREFANQYAQPFVAYAFLFECGGARIGHSADLGRPEDLEPLLTQPLDLLVCELAHFDPESLFEFLEGRDVRRIKLIHIGRSQRRRLDDAINLADRVLGPGVVSAAAEGEELRLLGARGHG